MLLVLFLFTVTIFGAVPVAIAGALIGTVKVSLTIVVDDFVIVAVDVAGAVATTVTVILLLLL